MSKYQDWYNSLPTHTKQYLSTQPIWRDKDMLASLALGFFVGLCIGLIY